VQAAVVVLVLLLVLVLVELVVVVVDEVPAASWLIWMMLPATVIVAVRASPEFVFTV
jgi:hypothetical protein